MVYILILIYLTSEVGTTNYFFKQYPNRVIVDFRYAPCSFISYRIHLINKKNIQINLNT